MKQSHNKYEPNDELSALLTKYVAGEADVQEEQQVENWIKQSAENEQLVKDFILLFNQAANLPTPPPVNEKMKWEEVKQWIEKDASESTLPWYSNRKLQWVSVVVLFVIIAMIWFVLQPKKTNRYTQADIITLRSFQNELTDTLPDGSIVHLNKQSDLSFARSFSGSERKVKMNGSIIFNVAHNSSKPFVIEVNDLSVKVIGTSFMITSTRSETKVNVMTGIVEVRRKNNKIQLRAGQQILIHSSDTSLAIQKDSVILQMQGKKDKPDTTISPVAYSDESVLQKAAMRKLISRIVAQRLAQNAESLNSIVLTNEEMIINDIKQPEPIRNKFLKQFPFPKGYGYYYGDVKTTGKGVFLNKEELKP